jgi:hypothetical protein
MAIDSPVSPPFVPVSEDVAADLMRAAGSRRDWTAVREALIAGQHLFIPDENLTKQTAKYLALSLQRRGVTKRLHVRRAQHQDIEGKLFWLGEEREVKKGKAK